MRKLFLAVMTATILSSAPVQGGSSKMFNQEVHYNTEFDDKEQSGKIYQEGIASNYGGRHSGKKTASGAIYNENALTAAHKTLPFGTKLRVTNKETGDSVIVTINDRGPFVKGRVIDLSREAFKRIAPLKQGVVNVKIEKV